MGSGRCKLNLVDLLSISIDVASGCAYLESQNYIHRYINLLELKQTFKLHN